MYVTLLQQSALYFLLRRVGMMAHATSYLLQREPLWFSPTRESKYRPG